jgi:SAM-dependent methyltransferase
MDAMSASLSPGLDTEIVDVLHRNRATYAQLPAVYERTGAFRREQAKRWLLSPLEALRPQRRGDRLLELGSADGYLTGLLAEKGYDVTAVEYTPQMCDATRRHAPTADVVEAEFLEHQFDATYDVILCSAFVHLFPPPYDRAVLVKVRDLLTDGGIAYLATTVHPEYSSGYEVKGAAGARYRTRYTHDAVVDLIGSAGLEVRKQYVARDRLESEKAWGNWLVARAES